jgi:hypothetical protein
VANENDLTESWTVDYPLMEFVDVQVELPQAQYVAFASKNTSQNDNPMFESLKSVLDDFLADRSCWEPPPATIRETFERLRDKLRERTHRSG